MPGNVRRFGAPLETKSPERRTTRKDEATVNTNTVSELARKLAEAVPGSPGGVGTMRADLERNFRGLLDSTFERMELVTREEFDVQRKVLERTRAKLTALEAQVAAMENESGQGG